MGITDCPQVKGYMNSENSLPSLHMQNILAALRHSLALISVKPDILLFADHSLDASSHMSSCWGLKNGVYLLSCGQQPVALKISN